MATRLRSTSSRATSSSRSSGSAGTEVTPATTRTIGSIIFGWATTPPETSGPVRADRARRRQRATATSTQINIAVLQHHQPAVEPQRRQHQRQHDHQQRRGRRTATARRPQLRRRARGCADCSAARSANGNTTQIVVLLRQHLQPAVQPVRRQHEQQHGGHQRCRLSTATTATTVTIDAAALRDGAVRRCDRQRQYKPVRRRHRATSSTRSSAFSAATTVTNYAQPPTMRPQATADTSGNDGRGSTGGLGNYHDRRCDRQRQHNPERPPLNGNIYNDQWRSRSGRSPAGASDNADADCGSGRADRPMLTATSGRRTADIPVPRQSGPLTNSGAARATEAATSYPRPSTGIVATPRPHQGSRDAAEARGLTSTLGPRSPPGLIRRLERKPDAPRPAGPTPTIRPAESGQR